MTMHIADTRTSYAPSLAMIRAKLKANRLSLEIARYRLKQLAPGAAPAQWHGLMMDCRRAKIALRAAVEQARVELQQRGRLGAQS